MANELICNPRRFDQPVIGDKLMCQGTHVRSGTDNRVDGDNTDSYVVTAGVNYVQVIASVAVWVRASYNGANAAAGLDQYLPANEALEIFAVPDEATNGSFRSIRPGDVIKCLTA